MSSSVLARIVTNPLSENKLVAFFSVELYRDIKMVAGASAKDQFYFLNDFKKWPDHELQRYTVLHFFGTAQRVLSSFYL